MDRARSRFARALAWPLVVAISACGSGQGGSSTSDEGSSGADTTMDRGGAPGTGGHRGPSGAGGSGGGAGGSVLADAAVAGAGGSDPGAGGRGGAEPAAGGNAGDVDAAVDAQGTDAVAGDGPVGGGSACSGGARLCDDFEAYAMGALPGAPRWQTTDPPSGYVALDVDGTHAFSGAKALHVKVNVNNTAAVHRAAYIGTMPGDAAFANLPGGTVYTRFMVYQTVMMNPSTVHSRLLKVGGAAVTFNFTPTVYALETINDNYAGAAHSGPKPMLNQWTCVEAQFGPTLAFWVDGKSLPAPGAPKGAPQGLQLGMDTWKTLTAELWIDDLVVDTKRIGCPTK